MAKRRRKVGWPKGRAKSPAHRKAISAGLKRYWAGRGKSRRRKMSKSAGGRRKVKSGKATWSRKSSGTRKRGRPKGSKNKKYKTNKYGVRGSWNP